MTPMYRIALSQSHCRDFFVFQSVYNNNNLQQHESLQEIKQKGKRLGRIANLKLPFIWLLVFSPPLYLQYREWSFKSYSLIRESFDVTRTWNETKTGCIRNGYWHQRYKTTFIAPGRMTLRGPPKKQFMQWKNKTEIRPTNLQISLGTVFGV